MKGGIFKRVKICLFFVSCEISCVELERLRRRMTKVAAFRAEEFSKVRSVGWCVVVDYGRIIEISYHQHNL